MSISGCHVIGAAFNYVCYIQDSAFGLFARRLEARTDNGELMNLIDDSGCPVNELIFPALDLEESTRALFADFKAFRFPSTPIVNFVATVQFCQEVCEPVSSSPPQ